MSEITKSLEEIRKIDDWFKDLTFNGDDKRVLVRVRELRECGEPLLSHSDFRIVTKYTTALCAVDGVEPIIKVNTGIGSVKTITAYSQNDLRWKDKVYAGGTTFHTAGCYVCCTAMILSLAGYTDTPVEVAQKMQGAGCFNGSYLSRADLIPKAYPLMEYLGPIDVTRDGELRWHKRNADIERVKKELESGPVIMEVDFVHTTSEFNQHYVIALRFTDDGTDIEILDPWDGAQTFLMKRYASSDWNIKRAIYGLRLLRPKTS